MMPREAFEQFLMNIGVTNLGEAFILGVLFGFLILTVLIIVVIFGARQ